MLVVVPAVKVTDVLVADPGLQVSLEKYRGHPCIIVNVASK